MPPTAVVLRDLGLGDLLVAVPALRLLRRALPDHEIVLVAPDLAAGAIAVTGLVLAALGALLGRLRRAVVVEEVAEPATAVRTA